MLKMRSGRREHAGKYRNNNSSNQRLSKESLVAAVAEGIQVSNLDFDIQLELDVG